jgi:cell wall assembly regulator SMI1
VLYEQLNFGACDASIAAFKTKIDLQLPNLFYEFYQSFNGSVNGAKPIWGKMTLLPLSGIIDAKKGLDREKNKASYWNTNWVPFLKDNKNSYICINLNKESDNIIQFNSTYAHQPVLFMSFENWLEAFYYLIANFEQDVVIDNHLYRSYFNSKIADLILR